MKSLTISAQVGITWVGHSSSWRSQLGPQWCGFFSFPHLPFILYIFVTSDAFSLNFQPRSQTAFTETIKMKDRVRAACKVYGSQKEDTLLFFALSEGCFLGDCIRGILGVMSWQSNLEIRCSQGYISESVKTSKWKIRMNSE